MSEMGINMWPGMIIQCPKHCAIRVVLSRSGLFNLFSKLLVPFTFINEFWMAHIFTDFPHHVV